MSAYAQEADEAVRLEAELASRVEEDERRLLFELALRFEEDGSFEAFVRLLWHEVETDPLEWAPYMSVVCDYLQRHTLGDPEYRRLLIMLPPGTAKSLFVSVFQPSWQLLIDPTYRRLFFTGNDSLSTRDSRRTRRCIQSETYQQLVEARETQRGGKPWGFARDQNQKDNFETTAGGFRQCLTLRTGSTGQRGAGITVDDPIDIETVLRGAPETVERRCQEANEKIAQTYATRINDPRIAQTLLCMQRLHVHDPAGEAAKKDGWKILCLPLHYDPEHPHASPDDPRMDPGEVLHPTRHTPEVVAEMEEGTGRLASAQLELRPVPSEGGMIRREWLRETYTCEAEDIAATADEVWVSSDAAKKGTAGSDFNAIQVWARRDGRRYLLDRIYKRMNSIDYFRAMDGTIAKWAAFIRNTAGGVLVEDTANGTNYLDAREPAYLGCHLIRFHPSKDTPGTDKSKGARARFYERASQSGAIVLPSPEVAHWVGDYVENIVAFPLGAHDDDMDASSQLMMRWTLEDQSGGWSVGVGVG